MTMEFEKENLKGKVKPDVFYGEHQQHYLGDATMYATFIRPHANEKYCLSDTLDNNGVPSSFKTSISCHNLGCVMASSNIPTLL